jgi:hypothetical protein
VSVISRYCKRSRGYCSRILMYSIRRIPPADPACCRIGTVTSDFLPSSCRYYALWRTPPSVHRTPCSLLGRTRRPCRRRAFTRCSWLHEAHDGAAKRAAGHKHSGSENEKPYEREYAGIDAGYRKDTKNDRG